MGVTVLPGRGGVPILVAQMLGRLQFQSGLQHRGRDHPQQPVRARQALPTGTGSLTSLARLVAFFASFGMEPAAFTDRAAGAVRNLLVDLRALGYDEEAAQAEVQTLVGPHLASALLAAADGGVRRVLEDWEPLIARAAAVAYRQADASAGTDLNDARGELARQPDWAALVPVLRRLISGDTDTDLSQLDPIDTAIATELRQRILNTSLKSMRPVTLIVGLGARLLVARPGMTYFPCRTHDPGGVVTGFWWRWLIADRDTAARAARCWVG